jgi:hypothetical protein
LEDGRNSDQDFTKWLNGACFALSLTLALVIGVAFVAWFLAPNALFGLGNKVSSPS